MPAVSPDGARKSAAVGAFLSAIGPGWRSNEGMTSSPRAALVIASVASFVAALVACGGSDVVVSPGEDAGISADGGVGAPVVVTTSLGAGALRVVALSEGSGGSLAAVTRSVAGHALHRVDGAGRIVWSKDLPRSASLEVPPRVARGRADRVVVVDTYAEGTVARAFDEAGVVVAERKLQGPLLGLVAAPKGGVVAIVRSPDGKDLLVAWDADGTAPREVTISPQPYYASYDSMAMDGTGNLWGAGAAVYGDKPTVVRLEPSGAWKLFPIGDPTSEIVGLREGGAVIRALTPSKILRLSASGEIVSERDVPDAYEADASALLVAPNGEVLRAGVYPRPNGGAGALGTSSQLVVTDVEGRRAKDLLFTYRGELGVHAVAAGKVWLGGRVLGAFAIGDAKVTSGPEEEGAPLLVGFDAYESLVPRASAEVCRAFSTTCDACRKACTVCGSTVPCVVDRSIVCACRAPEDVRACIGGGYPAAETERAISCFTRTCAEACGVTP